MPQRRYLLALLLPAIIAVAGCNSLSRIATDARMSVGDVGLADRCADIMQRAYPGGGIDITSKTANANMSAAVATVKGTRRGVPADGKEVRDVAVECRFDNGVLTDFRWTAGPLR